MAEHDKSYDLITIAVWTKINTESYVLVRCVLVMENTTPHSDAQTSLLLTNGWFTYKLGSNGNLLVKIFTLFLYFANILFLRAHVYNIIQNAKCAII